MPRYSTNDDEARHIARITHSMPIGGIVQVFLRGARIGVDAVMTGANMGNNGGIPFGYTGPDRPGPWQYYGEVFLQTIDGQKHIVDLLDIDRIEQAWDDNREAFEKAGLIQIVDWRED
ncbi:hypothetical protein [Caulobacter endophyticus]|uniref:hypothetical protein n=1 Tax=Caulobacter endophyticus TaxID=2172652 RepID=UPI00240F478F|nr:hypothetical protein [Caulobacter endophyticus]MDG2531279.1 hypothetical protein [Caulobacter endophyticus]